MSNQYNNAVGTAAETDLGLRNFMLGTYRYMALAMAVTAGVAYLCLLYTSPSPRDRQKSRMPSSA